MRFSVPGAAFAQAALVQFRVFQKDVESRRHRGVQAPAAVTKAAAQNIKIEESPGRIGEHLEWRHRGRLLLARGPRAEAIHRRHVVGDIFIAEMQNAVAQAADAAVDDDFVVRIAAADMAALAPEQSHRRSG